MNFVKQDLRETLRNVPVRKFTLDLPMYAGISGGTLFKNFKIYLILSRFITMTLEIEDKQIKQNLSVL